MKTRIIQTLHFTCILVLAALHLVATPAAKAAGFVSVGPMKIARNFHSATLLPSGKVLVAGGAQTQSTSRAELYDPATGTWTVTGALHSGHTFHTTILLQNGKVLLVDRIAELYDPGTGTWTLTGSMIAGGGFCTATLLPNGKVLATGGGAITGAELYDPAAATWSPAGPGSCSGPATLLSNGKVLVLYLLVDNVVIGSGLYDPTTGTWTRTGAPSRNYLTATPLPNGKVLAAGGVRAYTAELYDPVSGTWSSTGSPNWDRDFCQASLLRNGQVLITGGLRQGPDVPVPSAERYDPTTEQWTEIPMNEPHYSHTATLLPNGSVLVAGGIGYQFSLLSSAELYEPDPLPSLSLIANADQTATLSWTGLGTLEQTESLVPPDWQTAPNQLNPQTISTNGPMKFFRIRGQ